ncbi:MAG: shikimate dehydrogenase, partial [Methanomicrobiales archaeon]|nr:shikimate dehydrogenase [Methanomicrobiales archaeon]
GKRLARLLDLPYLDTDAEITRSAGMEIGELFARHGESSFRDRERAVIHALAGFEGVISTGGGAVLDPGNIECLRRNSTIILLVAEPLTIEARIRGGKRPALTNLPLREEILLLLEKRRDAYLSAADFCVHTNGLTPDTAAREILRLLQDRTFLEGDTAQFASMVAGMNIPPHEREILEQVLGRGENQNIRVLGVVGYPCRHSRSPPLFNALFQRYGLRMRYTRFEWANLGEVIGFARSTGMRGLSVTIPFKEEVRGYLDEEDVHTQAIGACNTVIFCGGKAFGYNTDWIGVMKAVEHLRGCRAVLIGAGGAAAAAAYALCRLDMDVTVLGRDQRKTHTFAAQFGIHHAPLEGTRKIDADLIVHATPVGMDGDPKSLLSAGQIPQGCTVFDLVYTPALTPLLREAQKSGARIIPGTEMFVRQACEQFRLFTGIRVQENTVREIVQ